MVSEGITLAFFSAKSESMLFKKYLPKFLSATPKKTVPEDAFSQKLKALTGCIIKEKEAFVEAFTLKSSDPAKNYERLEFLGDAVLGSIISEEIFHLYPDRDEGFLTQLKSKIVNRKTLNQLGAKLQLLQLIQGSKNTMHSPDLAGNLVESLVGALYISNGYEDCKRFITQKLFPKEQILKMEHIVLSYKSVLIEWCQSKRISIRFKTEKTGVLPTDPAYTATIFIKDKEISKASESSKKRAEEKASQRAFYSLNTKHKIKEDAFQHRR